MRSEYIDMITNGATDPVKVAKALLKAGIGPADAFALIKMQFGDGEYNQMVEGGWEVDAKALGWKAYADKYLFDLMSKGKKDRACPDGVVAITAGADVQTGVDQDVGSKKRVEISFWGWGRRGESWLLAHHILDEHEPFSPESQKELDLLLATPFLKKDGTKMTCQAVVALMDQLQRMARTRA